MPDENHEKFLGHLEASKDAVWIIARWYWGQGHEVMIPPTKAAPARKDWQEFADGGDLFVNGKRIEVKNIGYDFTCLDDWPFPNFFVCAKHAWDNADPKPYRICYLNKARTHIAVLHCQESCDQWRVQDVVDSRYTDEAQPTYVCYKSVPKFGPLTMRN